MKKITLLLSALVFMAMSVWAIPSNPATLDVSDVIKTPSENITLFTTVAISATVIAENCDVTSVVLNWGTESGLLTTSIEMDLVEGELYTAVTPIPAQAGGTTVYYEIVANSNFTPTVKSEILNYTVADPIASDSIFISQNCDPKKDYSKNRFTEIYNPTASEVDLTGWSVVSVQNGVEKFSWNLIGTIASGEALVMGFDSHTSAVSPDFSVGLANASWNGTVDDGTILKNASGDILDYVVGALFSDKEMVRVSTVIVPSTTYISSEWIFSSVDSVQYATPGTHECDLPLNFSPVITNFLPEDGSEIQKNSSFTISAIVTTSHLDGIDSVMLYSGSVSGVYDDSVRMTATVDVFSIDNSLDETGIYYGKIVAYGVNGDRTMSDEQSITIYVAGPEMFNTSPASGSVFDLGVPVVVETEVSAPVGVGIDSVMFFYGPAPEWMVMTAKCEISEGKYFTVLQFDSESAVYGQLVAYGSNGENDSTEIVTAIGQCGDHEAPVANAASELTKTTFTASWDASAAAEGYLLDVWTEVSSAHVELINEDFSDFSDWENIGTSIDNSHSGDLLPARAFGLGDSMISPAVDYPTELSFFQDASGDGNGQSATVEYMSDQQSVYTLIHTFVVDENGKTETVDLISIATDTNVKFKFSSNFNTWYLDDVVVEGFGLMNSYLLQDDSIKTGTSKEITGLAAGTDYLYAVKAYTEYGCQSDTSNTIMLTTVDLSTALSGSIDKSVRVSTSTGLISVEAAGVQAVTVFDIMGREIESRVMDTEASFAVKQGIYLVRVADTVSKVVVK